MKKNMKRINLNECIYTIVCIFSVFFGGVLASGNAVAQASTAISEQQPVSHYITADSHKALIQNISTVTTQTEASETKPLASGMTSASKAPLLVKSPETTEILGMEGLKKQLAILKLQNAILYTQNLIDTEKFRRELLKQQQEKDKLLLANELQLEKKRNDLAQLRADKEKLQLENELAMAKQTQLLANLKAMKVRLVLENELHEQERKKTFLKLEQKREQLAIQNAIAEEKNKQEELRIQLETAQLEFEMTKLEFEKSKRGFEFEELTEKLATREQREIWDSQVNQPNKYLKEPFVDGYLIISDRKITLDQVILPGSAQYINKRIHYYNNKNTEYPIFLIIDRCYGGSVMEGAKILEAMQNSRAPVYVVVKTLAASMAAIITTLSEHSYASPNAILVHHQMLSFVAGNQKQIEEEMEIAKEWIQRIMYPVAQKMGITMEEFVEKMYKNNSGGNWREFADKAVKLKWVEKVVTDMRDTSIVKQPPDYEEQEEGIILLKTKYPEKTDVQGKRYVELPRLTPVDIYYLYNPYNYFR